MTHRLGVLRLGFTALMVVLVALLVQRFFPKEGAWSQFDGPAFFLCSGVIVAVARGHKQMTQLGHALIGLSVFFGVLAFLDLLVN